MHADFAAEMLANPQGTVLVAEHGSRLEGYLYALRQQAPDTPIHVPRQFSVVESLITGAVP